MRYMLFRIVAGLVVLLFFIACNTNSSSRFVGKWCGVEGETSGVTIEFIKDGRVINTYAGGATLEGSWLFQSKNIISVSIDPWKLTAEIVNDTLILSDSQQEKRYRKIP